MGFSWGKRERAEHDSLRQTILLGFDVLLGRFVFCGVETLDAVLETRRSAVAVLEFPIVCE